MCRINKKTTNEAFERMAKNYNTSIVNSNGNTRTKAHTKEFNSYLIHVVVVPRTMNNVMKMSKLMNQHAVQVAPQKRIPPHVFLGFSQYR